MSSTPSEAPVGVFVDCAETALSVDLLALNDRFAAALAAGDIEAAQQLNTEIAAQLAEQQASSDNVTVRDLAEDEIAAFQAAQADSLAAAKAMKTAVVTAALGDSDHWCARAWEDGTTLTDAQKTYRQQLRSLLPEIAAAADSATLDAIELPAPPA